MKTNNIMYEDLQWSHENPKRDSFQKYSVILADPPWPFRCWSKKGEGRSASKYYDVMSIEDIKALPVSAIAADDAALFLWVTNPLLQRAFDVIESWGFSYRTKGFAWAKRNRKSDGWFMGMGYYTRANDEQCLLATRGRSLPVRSHSVRSLIDSPVEHHSKKPDVVRDRILQLFGDLPRIELFARQETPGWTAIGNEISGRDIRDSLRELIQNN